MAPMCPNARNLFNDLGFTIGYLPSPSMPNTFAAQAYDAGDPCSGCTDRTPTLSCVHAACFRAVVSCGYCLFHPPVMLSTLCCTWILDFLSSFMNGCSMASSSFSRGSLIVLSSFSHRSLVVSAAGQQCCVNNNGGQQGWACVAGTTTSTWCVVVLSNILR